MADEVSVDRDLEAFLQDLNEVTYKHGLAIGDRNEVYVMNGEDYSRRYFLNEAGYLTFTG